LRRLAAEEELLEVLKFIFQRRLRLVIDTAFPLAEARAAQQRMERREQFGKIILHPWRAKNHELITHNS